MHIITIIDSLITGLSAVTDDAIEKQVCQHTGFDAFTFEENRFIIHHTITICLNDYKCN